MSSDHSRGMTRREFIARGAGAVAGASLLGGLGRAVLAAGEPARKPNIIYLFADQMRSCSMGCTGNPDVRTPNIDKMARQGILFTHATTTFPLCSPHRAVLLTGRYPISTGVITNDLALKASETTIGDVLKAQGYKTGYIGKWHLGRDGAKDLDTPQQGFDFWAVAGTRKLAEHKTAFTPDGATDLALQFIRDNAKEPFCLFMSWVPPHPPYIPPARYKKLYDPAKLTLRPNVKDATADGKDVRQSTANYYAMITGLDDNVGRVMALLDELGIADDTILCFSSDHGDMLGSFGRMNKNLPWNESSNVPLIIRYPKRFKAGQKSDLLIGTADIMPTLLSLCGVPVPKSVEGTDLSGNMLGKGGEKPDSVYMLDVIPGPTGLRTGVDTWRAIRTDQYTYARLREKPWLLYDNIKDPYQLDNLVDKPEYKEVQARLEARLQEWLKKTGDDFASIDDWRKRAGIATARQQKRKNKADRRAAKRGKRNKTGEE